MRVWLPPTKYGSEINIARQRGKIWISIMLNGRMRHLIPWKQPSWDNVWRKTGEPCPRIKRAIKYDF